MSFSSSNSLSSFSSSSSLSSSASATPSLPQLLEAMKDYEPTIPDEIIGYFLQKSGCSCADPKLKRLIALATQKFIFEVAYDASQQRMLQAGKKEKNKLVLTMSDLSHSLSQHGIHVTKPEYFADNLNNDSND
eukprot:TRINITY_DN131_c0_g1_i1.p1 TRINITY_DN131_c0_g1~~TRINITY_DN131_c0_g1_i1.p1  ORF type:complete len:133 (+),score=44.76 TRINITY_DN131_c0_g1_i1:117-515(+)